MGQGRIYSKTNADTYMKGKVIEEVGALLDHMLVEDITTNKIIKAEFGPSFDTIRNLREKNPSISFDTIRKFCYIIGYYLSKEIQKVEESKESKESKKNMEARESRLKMLYEMKETYKKIYGMQAIIALNLIHKGKNLSAFVLTGKL